MLRNRIREKREEQRMSLSQLAEAIGVSDRIIRAIESQQTFPTAKLALKLCYALGNEYEELFYYAA